jgi:ankyrin repeat protein
LIDFLRNKTIMTEARDFRNKIFKAALAGDIAALETAIHHQVEQHDASPAQIFEFHDGKKRSALHLLCQSKENGTNDILEFVLNQKEWFPDDAILQNALKQKDINGQTPLMLAAQLSDPSLARRRVLRLLSKFPSLGLARSKAGATALHYAAAAGATPETIRALHESAKVAIHTFATKGGTPLHWALVRSHHDNRGDRESSVLSAVVDALLKCGADVNAHQWRTGTEHTTKNYAVPPPILMAISARNDVACNRLLQCNDIDTKLPFPGENNLLHLLAVSDMSKSLRTLLEKMNGDDERQQALTKTNEDMMTPLEVAAKEGTIECVRLLLGAVNTTNPSDDDAKAFIDAWKIKTKETPSAYRPQLPETSAGFEAEVQQKAIAVLGEPDVSNDKIQQATDLKTQGNKFFANKQWDAACTFYTQSIECNPKEAAVYSNRSSCHLKLDRPLDALADAVMARNLKPDWSKACYRQAVARLALERYEEAAMAAYTGLEIDPDNKELQKLLAKCVSRGREAAKASKPPAQPSMDPNDPGVIDRLVRRRYKELRAEGKPIAEAMQQAREELHPSSNNELDAGAQVAAMMGMI